MIIWFGLPVLAYIYKCPYQIWSVKHILFRNNDTTYRRGSHDDVVSKDLLDRRAHQLEALPIARRDRRRFEPSRVLVPDHEPHLASVGTLVLAVLARLLGLVESDELEVELVSDGEEGLGDLGLGFGHGRSAARGSRLSVCSFGYGRVPSLLTSRYGS